MKITGKAKAALERVQTAICSQHDHCRGLGTGKESKREAVFLFFLKMLNLIVFNGHGDGMGKNQR